MHAEEEFVDFGRVGVPDADVVADVVEVEKGGVVFAEGLDGGAGFFVATEHAAGGYGHELRPMELRHVYFFCGLQSGFEVVFAVVIVEEDEVIPAGMVAIEIDRALSERDTALPLAGEGQHDGHVSPS